MKRTLLTVISLGLSMIFAAAVMAAEPQSPASGKRTMDKLERFKGVVEKVDEANKDIIVKSKKEEKTFALTDRTKFTEGKKELMVTDLKTGLPVTVKYKKEGENLVALRVNVLKTKTTGMREKTPPTEKAPSEKGY